MHETDAEPIDQKARSESWIHQVFPTFSLFCIYYKMSNHDDTFCYANLSVITLRIELLSNPDYAIDSIPIPMCYMSQIFDVTGQTENKKLY